MRAGGTPAGRRSGRRSSECNSSSSAGTSPGAKASAAAASCDRSAAVDAEEVDDLLKGDAGPDTGKQRLAALGQVEPDGHPGGDAAAHILRAERRRDHTDERLGRAAGVEHVAGSDDANPGTGAEVVVAGDGEGGAARLRQRRAVGGAGRCAREHQLGQQIVRQVGPRQSVGEGRLRCQIEQSRPRRQRQLGHVVAAKPAHNPLANVQPAAPGTCGRMMVEEPAQLRKRAQRACGQTGALAEALRTELGGDSLRLVRTARVVPGDRRMQHPVLPVEQHSRLGHAGHADALHAALGSGGEGRARGLHGRSEERLGVDLGAGGNLPPGGRRPAMGELASVRAHDRRLAGGGADVDADEQVRQAPAPLTSDAGGRQAISTTSPLTRHRPAPCGSSSVSPRRSSTGSPSSGSSVP